MLLAPQPGRLFSPVSIFPAVSPLQGKPWGFRRKKARKRAPKCYVCSNPPIVPLEPLWVTVAGMMKGSQTLLPSGMRWTASWPRWLSCPCGTGRLPRYCVQFGRVVEKQGRVWWQGPWQGLARRQQISPVLQEKVCIVLAKCVSVLLHLGPALQETSELLFI